MIREGARKRRGGEREKCFGEGMGVSRQKTNCLRIRGGTTEPGGVRQRDEMIKRT